MICKNGSWTRLGILEIFGGDDVSNWDDSF